MIRLVLLNPTIIITTAVATAMSVHIIITTTPLPFEHGRPRSVAQVNAFRIIERVIPPRTCTFMTWRMRLKSHVACCHCERHIPNFGGHPNHPPVCWITLRLSQLLLVVAAAACETMTTVSPHQILLQNLRHHHERYDSMSIWIALLIRSYPPTISKNIANKCGGRTKIGPDPWNNEMWIYKTFWKRI